MIVFLICFVLISFFASVLKFSMLEKRWQLWISLAVLFIFCIGTYPIAIHSNNQSYLEILNDPETVSSLSVIQIIEAILMVVLAIQLIHGHFQHKYKWMTLFFSLLPSVVLLLGLFYLQVLAFVYVPGVSFGKTAFIFALSVVLICGTFVWLSKKIFVDWELRAELKIMVAFLQILLAMFLPIIVDEIKVPYSHLTIDAEAIGFTALVVLLLTFIGFIAQKLNIRIKSIIKL